MPSQTEILRIACAANKLPTSGGFQVLLDRLHKGGKAHKKCQDGVCTPPIKKATKTVPFKSTKKGGKRLSAKFYFETECNGKLKDCKPQYITQNNGDVRLKEIRIVTGPHGKYAKWVNVSE